MSEQGKIYVPGSAKQISDKLLKLNFPVDDLIALVKEHGSNGWISFGVTPRLKVGPKGQTHAVWVDKWKPGQPSSAPVDHEATKAALAAARAAVDAVPESSGEVPF
jgi:hypothetical protein